MINRFIEQSKKFGFSIVIAGSEGEISKEIAKGCHYIEIANRPVSDKHNSMIAKAKELDCDGMVLMGSDDIVDDNYWKFIYSLNKDEDKLIGLKDLYFYSTESKQIGLFQGYKDERQTIGAGRFFSRKILEMTNWKLWDDGLNKGLDTNCSFKLTKLGIKEQSYSMKESDTFLVDIKHNRSITNKAIINGCKPVNISEMAKKVTKKVMEQIDQLDPSKGLDYFDGVQKFESTGACKHMKKGELYDLEFEQANLLFKLGYII